MGTYIQQFEPTEFEPFEQEIYESLRQSILSKRGLICRPSKLALIFHLLNPCASSCRRPDGCSVPWKESIQLCISIMQAILSDTDILLSKETGLSMDLKGKARNLLYLRESARDALPYLRRTRGAVERVEKSTQSSRARSLKKTAHSKRSLRSSSGKTSSGRTKGGRKPLTRS